DVADRAELVAGGVEEGVVDLVVQERDDDVRAADRVVELRDLERAVVGRDPDVARLAQDLDGGLGDAARDDDLRLGHGRATYPPARRSRLLAPEDEPVGAQREL